MAQTSSSLTKLSIATLSFLGFVLEPERAAHHRLDRGYVWPDIDTGIHGFLQNKTVEERAHDLRHRRRVQRGVDLTVRLRVVNDCLKRSDDLPVVFPSHFADARVSLGLRPEFDVQRAPL